MGNLGEKQVVCHVAVGDVVVQIVQAKAVVAIDRLKRGVHELPVLVVVHQRVRVVVLEVCHRDQPPSQEYPRGAVIVGHRLHIVLAQVENTTEKHHAVESADDALGELGRHRFFPHALFRPGDEV